MKTKTLTIILILFSFYLFSQKSILLYTNFPSSIKIFENNKIINKTAIWEKNAGGYIIDIDDDAKTIISASDKISFKISNDNKTTKHINLNKGDELSIYKCLNSEEYCCEQLTAKQQSATKKIYAVSLMKKSALRNKTVLFKNLSNEFINKNEFKVIWSTDSIIQSISIFDVNSMEEIYNKKISNPVSSIAYSEIKNNLLSDFVDGGKYVLKIITRNLQNPITETKESSYGFAINPLAFVNKKYYFSTQESVNIEWNTVKEIKKISLLNKADNKELWSTVDFKKNKFSINTDVETYKIISGTEYVLKLILQDDNIFYYPFVVLLSQDESEELLKMVE